MRRRRRSGTGSVPQAGAASPAKRKCLLAAAAPPHFILGRGRRRAETRARGAGLLHFFPQPLPAGRLGQARPGRLQSRYPGPSAAPIPVLLARGPTRVGAAPAPPVPKSALAASAPPRAGDTRTGGGHGHGPAAHGACATPEAGGGGEMHPANRARRCLLRPHAREPPCSRETSPGSSSRPRSSRGNCPSRGNCAAAPRGRRRFRARGPKMALGELWGA